ncbi:MAG TPA: DNA primase [Nanoarchaeota archaeon]|nr:DNA primase [Nanoarchaeota archaeon]
MQKEGKIGRIEVSLETEKGVTKGEIEIPTSLDKAETALIAAALETIERVGPSESKIKVEAIEDVRASKREYVMDRAKKLLKDFQENSGMPESGELKMTITDNVRMMEIVEYGRDRLPAGSGIDESQEMIIVEGRADVLNLLRCGIKNAIALNGTSVPETIKELSRERTATLFVDGDRGGDLITKDVIATCEIAYVARAPDGKEVEELTKKEVLKALRDRMELGKGGGRIPSTPSTQRYQERSYDDRGYGNRGNYRNDRGDRGSGGDRGRSGYGYRGGQGSQGGGNRGGFRHHNEYGRDRDERREPMAQGQEHGALGGEHGEGAIRRELRDFDVSKPEEEALTRIQEEIIGTRGAYLLDSNLEILGKVPLSELPTALKGIKAYAIIADGVITSQTARAAELSGVEIILAKEFVGRGNFKAITFTQLARVK